MKCVDAYALDADNIVGDSHWQVGNMKCVDACALDAGNMKCVDVCAIDTGM